MGFRIGSLMIGIRVMALRNYVLNFEDVTKTGLSLTFTVFSKVSDNGAVTPPTISELGNGFYKYSFDIETLGEDIYFVTSDGGTNILTGLVLFSNNNSLQEKVDRLLGLDHENQFIDQTIYDGNDNLTSARLRIYSTPADVGTGTNVINTYTITSTYTGSTLDTFASVLTG